MRQSTQLMLVTVLTLNQTHNSTIYACGTDSIIGYLYELDFNQLRTPSPHFELQTSTLNLRQVTSPHSELVNMSFFTTSTTYDA